MTDSPWPKNWEIKKLSQIAELIRNSVSPDSVVAQYIGLEHIEKYTLRILNTGNSIDTISKKYLFKNNDILFGRLRPYFRKIIRPRFDGVCSTDIFVFRAKNGIYQKFLFYFLAASEFVQVASRSDYGTKMPRADWNFLKNTTWAVPPFNEQETIAEILSSMDAKIDFLRRQNITLEALAETVYKDFFVADKKNWPKIPAGQLFNLTIGRTPPRQEKQHFSFNSSDKIWVSIKDMAGKNLYISDSSEYLTGEAVKQFNIPVIGPDTVILSFKMTVGRVAVTTRNMYSNEAIAAFNRSDRSSVPYQYLYFFLKLFRYDELGTTSTITTSINTKLIKDIGVPVPDRKLLDEFTGICDILFNKIKYNIEQIGLLENMRDLAIDKLVTGRFRVSAEKQTPAEKSLFDEQIAVPTSEADSIADVFNLLNIPA
ncbi:MAG: restriction endonuclease subunit S [Deltaproteobacteria bacterium]|nr:restriction endonuclease subunit S [Deltaproteobacteria bacterium]